MDGLSVYTSSCVTKEDGFGLEGEAWGTNGVGPGVDSCCV